jgi:elongation factor Ts
MLLLMGRPHIMCSLAAHVTSGMRALASASTPALDDAGPSQTALIKQLRERSGSPISDIKSCLEACHWDPEAAFDALRKKGLAAAAKKASKHAAEGLVGCLAASSGQDAGV